MAAEQWESTNKPVLTAWMPYREALHDDMRYGQKVDRQWPVQSRKGKREESDSN
jgi:hypothetical protein